MDVAKGKEEHGINPWVWAYACSSLQGSMTRDELAQLLLCYIGTAADIIEFFDSFKVEWMVLRNTP